MICADVDKFIHVYLDGEFVEEERDELERHMAGCARCARMAAFERRFKSALREAVCAPEPVAAPPGLAASVRARLDAEARARHRKRLWPIAGGVLAAAAAVAFAIGTVRRHDARPILADAIARHQRELPVEIAGSDPQSVGRWFAGKVDVPVHPPALENASTGRLLGGRVSHVRERQAAQLVYDAGGRRVSVFIFDPSGMPLETSDRRMVAGRPVWFTQERGTRAAVTQEGGLGYLFTGDVPDAQMLNLVQAAFGP